MTKLSDIVDLEELSEQVELGHINVRTHPEDNSLAIYNYSKTAGYSSDWNPAVRACRGLIVDLSSGEVLARPWPKFFNYSEPQADEIAPWERVSVWDKLDGSLGIVYIAPDGLPAVATRGSFTSEQAIWATEFLRAQAADWRPLDGVTYLVEIIYPDNQIVVDYGGREDLALLSMHQTDDGQFRQIVDVSWPFGKVDLMGYLRFGDFLQSLLFFERKNAEGVVVATDDGRRLKFKQDDYVEKHRIVTNLTPLTVWRYMRDNGYQYERLFEDVPEEFWDYVQKIGDDLLEQAHELVEGARMDLRAILEKSQDRANRKYLAEKIKKIREPGLAFALLDNRDPMDLVWKWLRPRL